MSQLSKMGYKEGSGLGSGTGGMASPLDVVLKSGRAGVGVDEAKVREKRQALEMSSERRQVSEQVKTQGPSTSRPRL
jgi:hypothetical protein